MYTFIATFYNMDGEADLTKTIEIDAYNFELSEKQTYVLAMEKAYDMSTEMGEAWRLGSVEFLSC